MNTLDNQVRAQRIYKNHVHALMKQEQVKK